MMDEILSRFKQLDRAEQLVALNRVRDWTNDHAEELSIDGCVQMIQTVKLLTKEYNDGEDTAVSE